MLMIAALVACDKDGDFNPDDLYAGDALYGEECDAATPCAADLICAGNGTCHEEGEPGTAAAGEECVSSEYCQFGLVCNAEGVCASDGGPGTGGHGDGCEEDTDCQIAMQCVDGGCYGLQVPLWFGHDCGDPDDEEGAFRVYFEVPGEQPNNEFYRLPFPNDGLAGDDGLDMSGHPSPGALIPEVGDVVGTMLDVLSADFEGFGNNQVVFMRFSDTPDWDTLELGEPGDGTAFVIDITEGAETYGQRHSGGFRADSERGNYICDNWIAFHPSAGRPYLPGHTYAAVLTTQIRDRGTGDKAIQDADFTQMLSTATPDDTRLHPVWSAYEPFRQWLINMSADPTDIAAAAVFTVGDPGAMARDLLTAVDETTTPTLTDTHLCQDGDAGPFADEADERRGCHGAASSHHEVQGIVALPNFQEGAAPYKEPSHGGAINVGGTGMPSPVGYQDVVFSLTVPKGTDMPEGGWPLVLYAHGTGGNYRSFVADGVADLLSSTTTDDGEEAAFAILSIDGVVHGPRAREENWDDAWLALDPSSYEPGVLFFNVFNPRAARDNALQATADYFQLARLVGNFDWEEGDSPTGEAIAFDPEFLFYMGHSQGANTGVTFSAFQPDYRSTMLSGAGGLLVESLLYKRSPYDLRNAISVGIADPYLDRWHPMLNLVQALAERSDPINHATHVVSTPHGDSGARDLFQSFGYSDSYTPEETQYSLARAFGVDQITNGNEPLESIDGANLPLSGNVYNGDRLVTAAVVLYSPEGDADGHYVIFDLEDAKTQYSEFFATAVVDELPTIPSP